MNYLTFGEPHSLRRYIEFGIIAGAIAGISSTVFGVNPLLLGTAATAIAVWLAGRPGRTGEPVSSKRSPPAYQPVFSSPIFISAAIYSAVFVVFVIGSSISTSTGHHAAADSAMWVLFLLSIVCFGALIINNR